MHNEHPAMEQGTHLWHVQDLTTTESTFSLARGFGHGLGLEAIAFLRHVTTRIRFQDDQRRPLDWPQGDIHHRNETLLGSGDPWLLLQGARGAGPWTLAARAGVSIPLGRTEPNPFELGRLGLPHQHIQFGTGTVDPLFGIGFGRRIGSTTLTLTGLGRLVVDENDHGYRAGNRYHAALDLHRRLSERWHAGTSLQLAREQAERWDGRLEEEGNLGRTDALLGLSLTRTGDAGSLTVAILVPVHTRASGSQLDYPVIVSIGTSR